MYLPIKHLILLHLSDMRAHVQKISRSFEVITAHPADCFTKKTLSWKERVHLKKSDKQHWHCIDKYLPGVIQTASGIKPNVNNYLILERFRESMPGSYYHGRFLVKKKRRLKELLRNFKDLWCAKSCAANQHSLGNCRLHGKAGGFFSEKLWGDGCLKKFEQTPRKLTWHWKIPMFPMGNTSSNGGFSIVILSILGGGG